MESIEARALKSSFLSQMAMKANSQVLYNDDGWCVAGMNSVNYDDFPVEDLLNLDSPKKEFQEGCVFQRPEQDEDQKKLPKESKLQNSDVISGELQSLSSGDLVVPVDELENLEWLSQFVDDSTSALSLLWPAGSFPGRNGRFSGNPPPLSMKARSPCFPLPIPTKPRSSRSRSNGRRWSLPLSASESSSTSLSSHGSSTLTTLFFENPVQKTLWFSPLERPPAKKQKMKTDPDTGVVSGRRCTHCQVQKTPQWRAGPLGPKTLCNACGVRFKSGRLFPEYRPACSPSFSQDIHSNSHRKVLEMRRRKENLVEPDLMVQSF
ncbi:GATA transcription factor 5-like [Dorcoceras hygrometricum]|uniref:GATA transcription factor n=1 Tax=Dorcoceras hygrometricum TaxID=472368 RepID=A0A2Z7AXJ6_9LAMI|nr:GATA transcription factor 5-like [Dorcoceras hygrometricum]